MAHSQNSEDQKVEVAKKKELNLGRTERYEDKIVYYEEKLNRAKEIGGVRETCEAYEGLATMYTALAEEHTTTRKQRPKRIDRDRPLNCGRTERYEDRLKFYKEKLKRANEAPGDELQKYTAYDGLAKTYRAMAIQEEKAVNYDKQNVIFPEKGNGNTNWVIFACHASLNIQARVV